MPRRAPGRPREETALGQAADLIGFAELGAEDAEIEEIRDALARALRTRRERAGLTQIALARRLGTSQSRVAKMEGADAGVSIELLMKGLLVSGATRSEVGRVIFTP